MTLHHIRLELARCEEFPNGSSTHGYEFVAPVNKEDHLDPEEWRQHKESCTVHRFWGDEEPESGRLIHIGRGWHFHYEGQPIDDDEPLFKLDRHVLKPGDYLSVTEHDGVLRPFRIVTMRPV